MQIVDQFYPLLILCSVIDFYKSISRHMLGFLYMDCASWFQSLSQSCDFGVGFLVFGCFKQLFNIICIILFINLGIKAFQFRFHYKGLSTILHDFSGNSGNLLKNGPFLLKKSNSESNGSVDNDFDGELSNADEVFDVMSLRKLVKRESRRANDAYVELDRERAASATASTEAMAVIRRLQKEKSLIEMELNQYCRIVEEKLGHDQVVIESLKRLVVQHESARSYMNDQLGFYQKKLKILAKGKDGDVIQENVESMSISNSSIGEGSLCRELDYHSSA